MRRSDREVKDFQFLEKKLEKARKQIHGRVSTNSSTS